jgi:glutaredoxin
LDIKVYGKEACTYCVSAKELLERVEQDYTYIDVMEDLESLQMLRDEGHRTVPVIYINGKHLGGYMELVKFFKDRNEDG